MTLLRRLPGIAICLAMATPVSAQPASDPLSAQVQELRQALDAMQAQIALGRFGSGSDIAEAVAFLAGPGAAYITGETLHVNGGMYMA